MYGNGLDMRGHVDSTFRSKLKGGIWLIRTDGDYSGPGGTWQESETEREELKRVNIQPARWREVTLLAGEGGVAVISDFRTVHINDGKTYLMPDESGEYTDQLEFSDGVTMRRWRVMTADNRPWRSFCRAVVQVIRETGA
ncbi:hypothetical protein EKN38_13045 [Enterobacter sp. WCHEn045836]|uniref:hypothetical protein n=1 Tax=Enterobacter sp. WCHEn045836 TaxID=2497434 RepID=UPI000F837FFB|nr:hypothetical protein [Enterobacter sp. WCHEn045836]RTQ01295.1 hypothetical protein EKN38_13045 [Enterobacter sp. WCHEn045836]